MLTFRFICLVLALVCFAAAAAGVSSRIGLQPLGLALLTLGWIVP